MDKRSFTLTELVIGLAAGAIVILTIGVISSVGISSSNKLRKEAEVYNDIRFGFDLIEHSIRKAKAKDVTVDEANATLKLDGFLFQKDDVKGEFFYTIDPDTTTRHVIITGVNGLQFTPHPPIGKLIQVDLSGSKEGVAFYLSTSAMRRN